MEWATALFGEKDQLSLLQECARAILIFAYGLTIVRMAGRRIFGKWSALDIVVSIIIGSNLSRALTGGAPLPGTLAATTLLLAIHWIIAHLAARSPALSHLVEGTPIVLARDGKLIHDRRMRHSISGADLGEALRQSGVDETRDTKTITLEPSGKITILKLKS